MPTIWWLDTLKGIEKIIRESAFGEKKKKPGLKFNLGLALTHVQTTGHRSNYNISPMHKPLRHQAATPNKLDMSTCLRASHHCVLCYVLVTER